MSLPDFPIVGGCQCGRVRYRLKASPLSVYNCHCKDCQKSSGAGGSVNAMIPTAGVRITQGTPKRFTVTADSGRTLHRFFCGDCGSPLFSRRELTPENTTLRIGTLDNAPPMKIAAHIWTRSARPWTHIDPASQQFPGQPDAPSAKK